MPYLAKDKEPFTNRMAMKNHDASLQGQGKMDAAPPAKPADAASPADPMQQQQGGGDITSDPEAMAAVDLLKQKGFTGEDVEMAMGGGDGSSATQAAPLQIPGL